MGVTLLEYSRKPTPLWSRTTQSDQASVASLPRPGGNVTGLSLMQGEIAAKSLQMLKEAAPQVGNVGVLTQSDFPRRAELMKELEPAAASLGVRCCRSTSARPRTCSAVSMR